MEQVPELARSLLQGQGVRFGKKSRLQAWTEVGPVGKKGSERPDGRIEVESTRGQRWVALLEAKIGKAALNDGQIAAYLAESRSVRANALITISNEFAVLANHHPTYRRKTPKGITLLHWSWSSILTKCRLLTQGGEIEDRDHRWVIEHLVDFLSHSSTGVVRFDRMPSSWKEITRAVSAGAGVSKSSDASREVAAGWIQEVRDLGLQLTGFLKQPVPVKLSRTGTRRSRGIHEPGARRTLQRASAGGGIPDSRRCVRAYSPGGPQSQDPHDQHDAGSPGRPQDRQGACQLAAASTRENERKRESPRESHLWAKGRTSSTH